MNKQIEEMASIIRVVLEERTDIGYIPDLAFPIAKKLLGHYQPKIPKDSVVLTKEELNQNYISTQMYELAKAFHDEKCAEFEKLCYDYYKLKEELDNNKVKIASEVADLMAKERKEAVEEFVTKLKNKTTTKVNGAQFTFTITHEMLDETLWECGI